MGTRRLGLALVAAVIISIVITSIFYVKVTREQAAAKPQTRHIVAAATSLQPGTPLTAENLTEINWPANVPMDGLIEKKEEVVGQMLVSAIGANAPILKHDLAPNGSFGLAAKIPDGMRATAVKTNEVSNVAGFIFPGSHVDVLITMRSDNNAGSITTRTVLQNVQVLAAGTKTDPDPNGKPENVGVVTLLVTPEESEKLALAQNQAAGNQGTIHFVLRNGGDVAMPDTAPVDLADLTGAPRKAPQATTSARRAAPKAQPVTYSVETFSGGKVSVAKFPAGTQ
jgi:pilus assembly protein CpaB